MLALLATAACDVVTRNYPTAAADQRAFDELRRPGQLGASERKHKTPPLGFGSWNGSSGARRPSPARYHQTVLPIASNEREFEVPGFVGECISCGPQALRNAVARYSFGTYAGFFGLLKRVEIHGTCTKCEDEVLIPEAEVPQSVREQIPFMHRKGLLILPLVLLVALVIAAIAGSF